MNALLLAQQMGQFGQLGQLAQIVQPPAGVQTRHVLPGCFEGIVKVFNAERGYGFLAYENLDIYLHIKQCVDDRTPQPGDNVRFDLEQSKTKAGMMSATNISGGSGPTSDKGTGKGFSSNAGARVTQGPVGKGSVMGIVKSFSVEKGYGFVAPDGANENIFFHHKQFVDGTTPQNGDHITFDTEGSPLKPGQLQACNISGGTGSDNPDEGGKFGQSSGDLPNRIDKGAGYGASKSGKGKGKSKGGKSGPYGGGKDNSQVQAIPTGTVGTVPPDMMASLQALASLWGPPATGGEAPMY